MWAFGCLTTYIAPPIFLLRALSLAISSFITVELATSVLFFTRPNTVSEDKVSACVKAVYNKLNDSSSLTMISSNCLFWHSWSRVSADLSNLFFSFLEGIVCVALS